MRVGPQTRLLISGQAPGRRVHESGLPFDDPSGERLRCWMGVDRATFYGDGRIGVAAMAFCYPGTVAGSDLPAPPRCASLWRAKLLARLRKIELTLLVGRPAHLWTLGKRTPPSMDATMRAWRDFLPEYLVLPHPSWRNSAWLKRNPWFETEVTPFLRQRVRAILAA